MDQIVKQSDLSIIYYTANRIDPWFADRVRDHLSSVIKEIPLISISQKPLNFGKNICVGEIGASLYNIYRQILIGAKAAKTKFIACAEDDSLYNAEHFAVRPANGSFFYNINRWNVDPSGIYFHRERAGMCMCICDRDLLIETLEQRFKKYPTEESVNALKVGMGEPGRQEKKLGLPEVKLNVFWTELPTIHFNHRQSMGVRRKIMAKDTIAETLPHWGKASDLWRRFCAEHP